LAFKLKTLFEPKTGQTDLDLVDSKPVMLTIYDMVKFGEKSTGWRFRFIVDYLGAK
jgi:molybdenum cofactor biosynthesis enzyme